MLAPRENVGFVGEKIKKYDNFSVKKSILNNLIQKTCKHTTRAM